MFVRSGVAVVGVLAAVAVSPGVAFADADGSGDAATTSRSADMSEAKTGSTERDRTVTAGDEVGTAGTTTADDEADAAGDESDAAEEIADELTTDAQDGEDLKNGEEGDVDTGQTAPVEPGEPAAGRPVADEPAAAVPGAEPSADRGGESVASRLADAPAPETAATAGPTVGPVVDPETDPLAESTEETGSEPPVGRDIASATEPTLVPTADTTAETAESTSTVLATMTAAAASSTAEAVTPSPLELIGSWLFSALAGLVRLFDPKPSIPAGSLVTRQTSKLEVSCGCGETLDADWYFPNQAEEPAGLIYLQHGFFRSNANVSALAVQLAEQTNSVVVVPTVASNPFAQGGCWVNGDAMHRAVADLFAGDMAALTASATAAAGRPVTLPTQFVLAGQSAGGNLAASAAAYTVDTDAIDRLRAVVMFDGVDNGGRIAAGSAALTGVNARPVFQIAADCGLCNVFGAGTSALVDSRPDGFVGVRLEGGKHTDAEGASSGLIGMLTCGVPDSANVAAVPVIAAGWINDVFTGSQDGLYGAGGERLPVGAATAVVLGTGSGLARASAPVHVGWSQY